MCFLVNFQCIKLGWFEIVKVFHANIFFDSNSILKFVKGLAYKITNTGHDLPKKHYRVAHR